MSTKHIFILSLLICIVGNVSFSQTDSENNLLIQRSSSLRIDGDFPGGCCLFLGLRNDTVVCKPKTPEKVTGGLWYWFNGRLTGPAGNITIELHWPEDNEEYRKTLEYGSNQNFSSVLDRTLNISTNCRQWIPIQDVNIEGTIARFNVFKKNENEPLYISVGIPYFSADLQQLYNECDSSSIATTTVIAQGESGLPVRAIRIGPSDGGLGSFYLQALQHRTEWAGAHILTSMVRFLLSEEGSEIRKRFVFHIVPAMDAAALSGNVRTGNMNRDWQQFSFPETRGVRDYLLQAKSKGEHFLQAIDLHMGWSRRDTSVGCLTVSPPGTVSAGIELLQRQFAQYAYARCNWTRERIWIVEFKNGVSFSEWAQTTFSIPAQTAEFSRNLVWDRQMQKYVRITQNHEEQLGIDLAKCLAEFNWNTSLEKK